MQLLVACCIADILRIFAPDAPYKEPQHIKTVFMFLIKQLGGLKDPKVKIILFKIWHVSENVIVKKEENRLKRESNIIFEDMFLIYAWPYIRWPKKLFVSI